MKIFVLNSGSSSLKSSLYVLNSNDAKPIPPLWEGGLQWKGMFEDVSLDIKNSNGKKYSTKLNTASLDNARTELMKCLVSGDTAVLSSLSELDAIGHRIVHGGKYYRESVLINAKVKTHIARLAEYAPLHNQAALQGIEAMEKTFKGLPQIAVFDTAFHRSLPMEAAIYPVPYRWFEEGIQRYGFHGISYQYCARRAQEIAPKGSSTAKMVICHLGAGASLCAVKNGKSCDTTMGFTPLAGLMMNTRSGTIDPGILLERLKRVDLQTLTDELYRESGLLGVSGLSSDMREIFKGIREKNPRAQIAYDVYIHRLCSCLGSMIASLEGLDVLVFTAGIGENTPLLRQRVSERLSFLGVTIDDKKNEAPPPEDCDISHRDSKVRVFIIHTQEAFEIARECWRILNVTRKSDFG